MITEPIEKNKNVKKLYLPKVGFAGTGWIGRNRMKGLIQSGVIYPAAVFDPSKEMAEEAIKLAPEAELLNSYEDLINMDLDGIVIATPSSIHTVQTIKALDKGKSVFCQKPLGRNYQETKKAVDAAKYNNKLLMVDFSYRYLETLQKAKKIIESGEIGKVFSTELVFHNAYGPGKEWFYKKEESGGGCVIDLGIHLIDLIFWMFHGIEVKNIERKMYSHGETVTQEHQIEDYATALIELENNSILNLSCSWNLSCGVDAIIKFIFYGTEGALFITNINGSYFDFVLEKMNGRMKETLVSPPDEWGPKAIISWAEELNVSSGFDKSVEEVLKVSKVVDEFYNI